MAWLWQVGSSQAVEQREGHGKFWKRFTVISLEPSIVRQTRWSQRNSLGGPFLGSSTLTQGFCCVRQVTGAWVSGQPQSLCHLLMWDVFIEHHQGPDAVLDLEDGEVCPQSAGKQRDLIAHSEDS